MISANSQGSPNLTEVNADISFDEKGKEYVEADRVRGLLLTRVQYKVHGHGPYVAHCFVRLPDRSAYENESCADKRRSVES